MLFLIHIVVFGYLPDRILLVGYPGLASTAEQVLVIVSEQDELGYALNKSYYIVLIR